MSPALLDAPQRRSTPANQPVRGVGESASISDALSQVVAAGQALALNRFELMRLDLEAALAGQAQRAGLLAASGVLALASYGVLVAGAGLLLAQVAPAWLALCALALPHLVGSGYVLRRTLTAPRGGPGASEGATPAAWAASVNAGARPAHPAPPTRNRHV